MPELPYRLGGVDHVVVRAKNIDAMLGFYRDVLGCPVAKHNEPLGLWHLDAGGSMIDLVDMNGKLGAAGGPPPGPGRNVDHIAIQVERFDAEANRTDGRTGCSRDPPPGGR